MEKLQELEALRDKAELIEYFEKNNIDITDEEILSLKKQYEGLNFKENGLTMQQLDSVSGGLCGENVCRSFKFAIGATIVSFAMIGIGCLSQYLVNKYRK